MYCEALYSPMCFEMGVEIMREVLPTMVCLQSFQFCHMLGVQPGLIRLIAGKCISLAAPAGVVICKTDEILLAVEALRSSRSPDIRMEFLAKVCHAGTSTFLWDRLARWLHLGACFTEQSFACHIQG